MRKSYLKYFIYIGIILGACTPKETGSINNHESNDHWTELVVAESLEGWNQKGGSASYTVKGNTVTGTSAINTPNSFLCTNKMYSNFILELEVMVDTSMNSGIQIRSNSLPEYRDGVVHGYQVEIDPSERAWSGGIYEEQGRGWLLNLENNKEGQGAFKNNTWNQYRIKALGDSITTWINGIKVAALKDSLTSSGFIGLQVHSTDIETPMQVSWRNIRIMEINQQ